MKIIFLLLLVTLLGCTENAPQEKYPGTHFNSECLALWRNGYLDSTSKVKKCENTVPKFKIGQRVHIKKNYDSSCYAKITGNFRFSAFKKETLYFVDIYCGSQHIGQEHFVESDLKK